MCAKKLYIETQLSCKEAWICYHHGKEKQVVNALDNNSKVSFLTPPWKTLNLRDLKPTASQKGYLYNLHFLCQKMDEAVGLTVQSKPSIAELAESYKSEQIQARLNQVLMTETGRERRVRHGHWESLARRLRDLYKVGKSKSEGTKAKESVKAEDGGAAKKKADPKSRQTTAKKLKSKSGGASAKLDSYETDSDVEFVKVD